MYVDAFFVYLEFCRAFNTDQKSEKNMKKTQDRLYYLYGISLRFVLSSFIQNSVDY